MNLSTSTYYISMYFIARWLEAISLDGVCIQMKKNEMVCPSKTQGSKFIMGLIIKSNGNKFVWHYELVLPKAVSKLSKKKEREMKHVGLQYFSFGHVKIRGPCTEFKWPNHGQRSGEFQRGWPVCGFFFFSGSGLTHVFRRRLRAKCRSRVSVKSEATSCSSPVGTALLPL